MFRPTWPWALACSLLLWGGPIAPAQALSEEADVLWAQQGPLQGALVLMHRSASHFKGATAKGGILAILEAERDCLNAAWVALGAAAPQGQLDPAAFQRVQAQLEHIAPLFPTTLSYALSLHANGSNSPSFVLPLRRHPRWLLEEHGPPTGWQAEAVPSGLRLMALARH